MFRLSKLYSVGHPAVGGTIGETGERAHPSIGAAHPSSIGPPGGTAAVLETSMRIVLFAVLIAVGLSQSVTGASGAWADDRHEGYYYPKITSSEVYKARIQKLRDSDRTRRLGFVTGMAAGAQEKAYAPQMAFFAKGRDAEKAILVGLDDGRMDTLYRARAVLALLTATARATPVFRDLDPEGQYTFLDLLALLGFEELTVSDGRSYAHRIEIK